jgi:hypothetical protein
MCEWVHRCECVHGCAGVTGCAGVGVHSVSVYRCAQVCRCVCVGVRVYGCEWVCRCQYTYTDVSHGSQPGGVDMASAGGGTGSTGDG